MNRFQPPNAHLHLPRLPHLPEIRNVVGRGLDAANMIERRAASSSSATPTPSCKADSTSDSCQKPTDATATLPIVLGVVIPLTAALIAFVFFHRRYKKKLRAEDRADVEKYKSMDFGMDLDYSTGKKKKKNSPEMSGTYNGQHKKGLSVEAGSPYLFPGGRGSRESLASIARDHYDADHRYRHTGYGVKGDDMSIRSPSPRGRADTLSSMARSDSPYDAAAHAYLLGNAQALPKSPPPPRGQSLPAPPEHPSKYPTIQEPEKARLSPPATTPPHSKASGSLAPILPEIPRSSYVDHAAFRQSNNYLRQFIHSREPSGDVSPPPSSKVDSNASTVVGSFSSKENSKNNSPKTSVAEIAPSPPAQTRAAEPLAVPAPAPRPSPAHPTEKPLPVDPRATFASMEASIYDAHSINYTRVSDANSFNFTHNSNVDSYMSEPSDNEHSYKVTPPSPHDSRISRTSHASRDSTSTHATHVPPRGQSLAAPMPDIEERRESQFLGDLDWDTQRLSVLMRPLPPDDPTEDPETRANRIRSFYKEYFDESKHPQDRPPMPEHMPSYRNQPNNNNNNNNNRGGETKRPEYYEDYDTEYLNNGYNVYDSQQQGFVVAAPYAQPITRRAMTPPPRAPPRFQVQGRGRSSSGANSLMSARPPRGQSSMSNYRSRPGPGSERGRAAHRPPPQPLMSLKTPHLLKDDSALYTTLDLAPPPSFRDRQQGRRPDSPLGVQRPYSPSVRAHVPLNSSLEELSPMPSPHLLRKSGTFTALDFAPPTRLRGLDNGSDAGSMRSGKSGMSQAQVFALRSGAHRISRVPKQLAGTKDDIMQGLKPSWDLRY